MVISCEPQITDSGQQQMLGKWKYIEDGTQNACLIEITAKGDDGLLISNFACLQVAIEATMIDDSNLTIPLQTVKGDKFEGHGTIKKFKTMTLRFTYDDGREKRNIVANCTKGE